MDWQGARWGGPSARSSSSAVFGNALASTFTNNTSNGGYGSYNNSTAYGTGLAYLDSTLSGATAIGAILLIAQDTTPGQEFFCWALKTYGGNDELHRDCCHALYKSPGTTGWNSIAVFPRSSSRASPGRLRAGRLLIRSHSCWASASSTNCSRSASTRWAASRP